MSLVGWMTASRKPLATEGDHTMFAAVVLDPAVPRFRTAPSVERLRAAFAPWFEVLDDRTNAFVRLALVPIGFLPVTLIAASTFGLDLRGLAMWFLLPALAVLLAVAARHAT